MKTFPYRALIYFLVGCAVNATLTSCLKDQDDYFDQSASDRLQTTMDEVRQLLRSSEHGWEFEYYPGSTLSYGGVVYTVRFDSLTAEVSCSLIPDSVETTYYRITNDSGPVLTFDTYNHLLHYFSTPNTSEYEAKGGEFEFVVSDISADEIKLYGKKTRNTMYLRRLAYSPEAYSEHTISIFDNFVVGFTGIIGTAQTEARFDLGNRTMTLVDGTDTLTTHYTYNDRGIRLYQPLEVGGVTLQTLAFDIATATFTCLDDGGGSISLQGIPMPENQPRFTEYAGSYNLRYSGGSSSVPVRLEPNRLDGSYRMTGLNGHYSLVLDYDYATGDLMLRPQVIGDVNGQTLYFCTYSTAVGRIWLDERAGFTLKWNGNKTRVVYSFSATNPSSYNCDSGILVVVYTDEEGVLRAGVLSDADWMVNGSAYLSQLVSLQKQRE